MVEQCQRAADSAARQVVTGLVFLEGARAAANQLASGYLGEAEFSADALDFFRLKQAFGAGLQPV